MRDVGSLGKLLLKENFKGYNKSEVYNFMKALIFIFS